MKPVCAKRINEAAGRELSQAELEGIEARIAGSLRDLATKDRARFASMSLPERMAEATAMAKTRYLADAAQRVEHTIMEAGRKAALMRELESYKPGLKGRVHSLKNMIVSLEPKVDALSANAFRLVDPGSVDKGKYFGLIQDPERVRDLAAALFGEASSPEAKTAAEGLKTMLDTLAERYQRAGIPLNIREDYRTPQPQDPTLVARAGSTAWVEDHLNWIDQGRYVNPDGSYMSRDQLRTMLAESYRSIATDGANKRAEGTTRGSSLLGQTINAPRQLFFKDSASWVQAMEKYGRSTNIYELVSNHVRSMAKDITAAEMFGRNADANVGQALAKAYEADLGAVAPTDINALNSLQGKTQRLFDALMHPDRPGNEAWANTMVQLRGLMASSQLGSLVGAFPDLAGMKMAAALHGIPTMRVFRGFVDSMAAGAEKEAFLHRLGVWQDGFQHAAHRMGVDEFRNGWGTWLNELTHRAMGLNAFDRGMRAGFGRVVMDTLGQFSRKFATLEEAEGASRLLRDQGVTQDTWNVWRAADLDTSHGTETLLTPDSIYRVPDAALDAILGDRVSDAARRTLRDHAAEKLLEVTYKQMQFGARGASGSSIEDRAAMHLESAADAGSVMGELKRFALQFKSVPVGIFRAHWNAMQSLDTWGSKAAYAAKFAAYSTMMGALAVELKAIINGQNPRTMNPDTEEGRKFWMEALASGGGLGLYGDLFANGSTRYGSGPEVLAGPGIGAMADLVRELGAAREEAMNGETNHDFSLAGIRWVRKNAVPLANLWYTKAAFNHMVYDHLQDFLAPGSSDRQRQRMESKGISYWWAPGEMAPTSTPDLGTTFRSE